MSAPKEDTNLRMDDTYRPKLEKLLGRPLPIPTSIDSDKDIPGETMEMFYALQRLIDNPDFIMFMAFMRQKCAEVGEKYHPAKASDYELRWAKACELIPPQMAEAAVKFVAQIDRYQLERKKALAEKKAKDTDPNLPQTTPPPP